MLYSAVIDGRGVLSECRNPLRSERVNIAEVMHKIRDFHAKEKQTISFPYDDFYVHSELAGEVMFFAVVDQDFGRGGAFKFINEVKTIWSTKWGDEVGSNRRQYMGFQTILKEKMDVMNDPTSSHIENAKRNISEINDTMKDNIGKVVVRGEELEDLVDRADELEGSSAQFRQEGSSLRRLFRNRVAVLSLIIACIVIFAILILFLFICGGLKCVGVFNDRE